MKSTANSLVILKLIKKRYLILWSLQWCKLRGGGLLGIGAYGPYPRILVKTEGETEGKGHMPQCLPAHSLINVTENSIKLSLFCINFKKVFEVL